MRRKPIGYYELNGARHVAFHGKPIPEGATLHRGESMPGPQERSRDERIEQEIRTRLPGILRMIRNHADFSGELQRQIQDIEKEL